MGKKRLMRRLGCTEFTTTDIRSLNAKVRGRAGISGGYGDLMDRYCLHTHYLFISVVCTLHFRLADTLYFLDADSNLYAFPVFPVPVRISSPFAHRS